MNRIIMFLLSLLLVLTNRGDSLKAMFTVSNAIPTFFAETDFAYTYELTGRVGGPSMAVAIQGDFAFLGYSFEFAVVDLSNPEQPVRVGYLPLSANDVTIEGNFAYIAGRQGLSVVDISRPEQPIMISALPTPKTVTDIALSDGFAFVVGVHAGLIVVDITDPSQPEQVSTIDIPGRVDDVALVDNYVYLATSSGLKVVEIGDPYRPVEIEVEPVAPGV
jgi:hypothetical protein